MDKKRELRFQEAVIVPVTEKNEVHRKRGNSSPKPDRIGTG
jgi:hypothetical protein